MLKLDSIPRTIDGVDIAHLGGNEMVGSLVRFVDGLPFKPGYRKYQIKSVEGIDDFAAIREVVARRIKGLQERDEPLPDIWLIDGGKGQLCSALAAFDSLKVVPPTVIALAKREEQIFVQGRSEPIVLSRRSFALRLLQYVRDEAHRFAQHYHHLLRKKRTFDEERIAEKSTQTGRSSLWNRSGSPSRRFAGQALLRMQWCIRYCSQRMPRAGLTIERSSSLTKWLTRPVIAVLIGLAMVPPARAQFVDFCNLDGSNRRLQRHGDRLHEQPRDRSPHLFADPRDAPRSLRLSSSGIRPAPRLSADHLLPHGQRGRALLRPLRPAQDSRRPDLGRHSVRRSSSRPPTDSSARPAASTEHHSLFINGPNGRFEDHILQEVIPFLTAKFSIRPEREAHA